MTQPNSSAIRGKRRRQAATGTDHSHVLFAGLSAYGAYGGIQRFNRRIVTALEALAIPVRMVMKDDGADAMPTTAAIRSATGAGGSTLAFVRAFIREARCSDVLLLGHINLLPFAALFRLMRPRGRIVLFAHGIEVWGDPRYRTSKNWEGWAIRLLIDEVAIVSRYSRERMQKAFGLDEAQFSLFPNTVSVSESLENIHPAGNDTVLVVSRLGPNETEKNVGQLIRAMPKLLAKVPVARLRIIGDGALRPSLEALAKDLEVAEAVRFDGFVSDDTLAQAYDDAALFALLSSKEGFGIVYLEAWLRGRAVIASKHGAGAEVVSDGVDGVTVEPADINAVADAMIRLLQDPALRRQMATVGLDKVRRCYSDQMLQATLRALVRADSTDRRTTAQGILP